MLGASVERWSEATGPRTAALCQITLKEEVPERSNDDDSAKATNFLPRRSDIGFDDVCGDLESQTRNQPAPIPQIRVTKLVAVNRPAEDSANGPEEGLDRSQDDDH